MARIYRSNWNAKKMEVNFNQKQWRQDLAYFLANKLNWNSVRVTRSKSSEKGTYSSETKEFEIFDSLNNICKVKYSTQNEIITSNYPELVSEYMKFKEL